LTLCPAALAAQTAPPQEVDRTLIVLDGSGSMWGQIDGCPKLEIAREVLGPVPAEIAPERALGLMAYGHRRRGIAATSNWSSRPPPAVRRASPPPPTRCASGAARR
jgi:Ca-activated chloride channel family protein